VVMGGRRFVRRRKVAAAVRSTLPADSGGEGRRNQFTIGHPAGVPAARAEAAPPPLSDAGRVGRWFQRQG
jgi:hypothetical protein